MKKIIIISTILLFSILQLFASSEVDTTPRRITAIKRGDLAVGEFYVRILDTREQSVEFDSELLVSEDARGNWQPAFYWNVYGNVFGNVSVTFRFSPMYLNGTTQAEANKRIDYYVRLEHVRTRVGNMYINDTPSPGAITYNGYDFHYAEDYTITNPATKIQTMNVDVPVSYSLATNTTVTPTYSGNVCDLWNRYGCGYIKLDIPAEETGKSDGKYFSVVTIIITPGQ